MAQPWFCCNRIDVSDEELEPKLFRKAELKGNIDLDTFQTKQVGDTFAKKLCFYYALFIRV